MVLLPSFSVPTLGVRFIKYRGVLDNRVQLKRFERKKNLKSHQVKNPVVQFPALVAVLLKFYFFFFHKLSVIMITLTSNVENNV